jgi:hypothetical protein
VSRYSYKPRPAIGSLIALERVAWRVVAIREIAPANYTDDESAQWGLADFADPWAYAPFVLVLAPHGPGKHEGLKSDKRRHLRFPASYGRAWQHLDEHYTVCWQCHEIPPCLAHEQAVTAAAEMRKLEYQLSLLPGTCSSCAEPITSRQRTITFPGMNLLSPTSDAPVFHLRRQCRPRAAEYENLWVEAGMGERTWLTLRCVGLQTIHGIGPAACDQVDCPGEHVQHRSIAWCTNWGTCERGCTRDQLLEQRRGRGRAIPPISR